MMRWTKLLVGVWSVCALSACAGSYDAVVSTGQIGEQLIHRTHSVTLDWYICEATYLIERPATTEDSPPYPGDCDKVRPASRGVALQIAALAVYGEALQDVARGTSIEDQGAVLFAELATLDPKGFEAAVKMGTKQAIDLGPLLTRDWISGKEDLSDLVRMANPVVQALCDKLVTYLTLQDKRIGVFAGRLKERATVLAAEGRGKEDASERDRLQDAARGQLFAHMQLLERQHHLEGLIRSIQAFSAAHQLLDTNRETLGQAAADQKLLGEVGAAIRTSFKKTK